MLLALTFVVPTLCGQVFTPTRPLLLGNRRAIQLVIVSVLLQLAANQTPELASLLVPLSFAGGTTALTWIVWTSGNHLVPTVLAALGGTANLLPIAWYGAMPVRAASRQSFSSEALTEPSAIAAKHAEVAIEVSLANPISLLTDWIPVSAINAVVSVGDVVLVAALLSLGVTNAVVNRRSQPTP